MNEIQALKDRRDQLLKEADQLHTQMMPFEAALEDEQSIEPAQERELRDKYNELKTRFDARKHEADLLDRKINRRETLINSHSLMAGYVEAMNTWKVDEQDLNEKRQSLSTRLEQIKQRAVEDMAKARQAETNAATAYA
jgi:Lon protease-like protein